LKKPSGGDKKLLDLTSREIKDGILKLEQEKKVVEEKRAHAEQAEEPTNCTATMAKPERLTTKRGNIWAASDGNIYTMRTPRNIGLGRGDQHTGHYGKGMEDQAV
jgi:hypothetical protein